MSEDEVARAARINNWTVGVAGGLLEGTFSKYAAELGKALDDADNLRVLPIVTYGAVGNVTDLIYLKGVDFAITYADVLDYFKNVEKIPGIERRVNYVIPMFQGEFHLFVRPEIKTIQDLAGKKVGFNTVGSAANYTGNIVFERLGIKVEQVFQNNALAIEAMRKGELAGIVHVVGKPNDLFSKLKPEPGFHFLPMEYGDKFADYYVPAELTSADYPNLIPAGQSGADHLGVGPARGLQLEERYRSLSPLRALHRVSVQPLRQAARERPISRAGGRSIWPAPFRAGRASRRRRSCSTRRARRRARRSTPAWRASRRRARHPTMWPSRSVCSASSWSGASSRSGNSENDAGVSGEGGVRCTVWIRHRASIPLHVAAGRRLSA